MMIKHHNLFHLLLWFILYTCHCSKSNHGEESLLTSNRYLVEPSHRITTSAVPLNPNNTTATLNTASTVLVFAGQRCYPNSFYPAKKCPKKTMCCCNSTCITWMSGELYNLTKLPKHPTAAKPSTGHKIDLLPPPCHVKNMLHGKPYFLNETWTYPKKCSMTQYTAIEADLLLRGQTIVFFGDSVIRQLYLRLVWHLRGFGDIMEHYFHAHAIYVRNTTHDYFYVGSEDEMGKRHFSMNKKGSNFIHNATFQLIFLWEPRLEDVDHIDLQLKQASKDFNNFTVVTGMHYWNLPDEFHGNAVSGLIQRYENQYPKVKLIWYPTPNGEYWERNRLYESFVDTNKTLILPSEAMANTTQYGVNTADQKHYMCAILKHLEVSFAAWQYKTPPNGDCRDIFNYNLVQIMLNNIAYDRLKDSKR